MKRKRLNEVYMREVIDVNIKTIFNEELNSYITYKHVLKTSNACRYYINGRLATLCDKGYTLLEYTPIDKNFNVRVFIDDKDNILMYYFDTITNMEYKDNEVYYDDLYLDVLYYKEFVTGSSTYIQLDDLKELNEAYSNNDITLEQYNTATKVAEDIMKSLVDKTNIYVNRGLIDYNKFKEEL